MHNEAQAQSSGAHVSKRDSQSTEMQERKMTKIEGDSPRYNTAACGAQQNLAAVTINVR